MIISHNVGQLAILVNIACKNKLEIFVRGVRLKESLTYSSCTGKKVKKGNRLFPFKKRFLFCHINK